MSDVGERKDCPLKLASGDERMGTEFLVDTKIASPWTVS